MAIINFKAINVAGKDFLTTKGVPGLKNVYYIPYELGEILMYNLEPIFCKNSLRCLEGDIIKPTNEEDVRIFSAESSSGYAYRVAFEPEKEEIFSEQIYTKEGTIYYRDKIDPTPIFGNAWKGNRGDHSIVSELSGFNRFDIKCLFGLSGAGLDLQDDLSKVAVIDQSADPPCNQDFNDSEIVLVNKIMQFLFNDSVGEVFKDGSYTTPKGKIRMPMYCGGGGYRRTLRFLRWWIPKVVESNQTLIVRNWKTNLHPLLAKALINAVLKNVETKGALFLDTYED